MRRAGGLALVLAFACGGPAAVREVPTVTVDRPATFVRQVKAEGVLQAVEATAITTPSDAEGPLKIAWLAPDGARVAAGEVVVRFDASEAARLLADSRDDVASASHEIDRVTSQGTSKRAKRERTAEVAAREAAVAREFESTDASIFSRVELAESAIDLEFAEAKVRHAEGVQSVERDVSKRERKLHEISRAKHEHEVERAVERLARLEVAAPHDGLLVLMRGWRGEAIRVGDTAWAGQKIAELPLVAKMQADVHVLEADAGDLAVGLAGEVVIEAHPDRRFAATVTHVDTLAQPRHPDVPVHYFGVQLALAETVPELMRVGQRVRVTIDIAVPDALVVPRQAVFDRDGQRIVHRRTATGFEPVVVQLGPSSAGRVTILSGLAPGDEIALRDPSRDDEELLGEGDSGGEASPRETR